MHYDLWHKEGPKREPHAVQAFVFDGWSHEPLVINCKQAAKSAPQGAAPAVVRSIAPGVRATTRNPA
jgi:hypothetical protein